MDYFTYVLALTLVITNANMAPLNETDSWNGNWFPNNPFKPTTADNTELNDLNELFNPKTNTSTAESWKGGWFPHRPDPAIATSNSRHRASSHTYCDDGQTNIDIDFDPKDGKQTYKYLCLSHKSKYEPDFATSPLQREYTVPPAFKAPSYCLNETIEYEERLPTYGAHRYLYPKYGEYKFIPVQRWMHNLERGAIVMLYHPCANKMQIDKLRTTLNACLYRHIITPSLLLLPERPLALVAWGKSLEMSVVDVHIVVDFVKENAKKGPQTTQSEIQEYDISLLVEAKLVTDENDSELCANINL